MSKTKNLESDKPNNKDLTFLLGNSLVDLCIIDTGNYTHICNDKSKFHEFNHKKSSVSIANDEELNSEGYRSLKLNTLMSDNTYKTITLKNILYVLEIETNLF